MVTSFFSSRSWCCSSRLWFLTCVQTMPCFLCILSVYTSLLPTPPSGTHTKNEAQSGRRCRFGTWGIEGAHRQLGASSSEDPPWVGLLLESRPQSVGISLMPSDILICLFLSYSVVESHHGCGIPVFTHRCLFSPWEGFSASF